jgi:hypothetical protein
MDKQESRRYPIGKFEYGKNYSINETKRNIKVIASLPKELKKILKKISKAQLDTPYRSGGWTVRQVIHHLSDSHVNAYIRMKMAVTEKNPIIKPYDEQAWAELESGKAAPVKPSVRLLKVLHSKWIDFLESLSESDLEKGYFHPAMKRVVLLPEAIALYAWHTEHHLGHIRLVSSGKLEIPQSKAEQKFEKAAAKAIAEATEAVPAKKAVRPIAPKTKVATSKKPSTPVKHSEVVAKAPAATDQEVLSVYPAKKSGISTSEQPKAGAKKPKVVSTARAETLARIEAARREAIAEAEAEISRSAKVKKEKTTIATAKKTSTTASPKIPATPKAVPVKQTETPVKIKKESTTSDDVNKRRAEGLAKARAVKQAKAAAEKDAAAQLEKPTTDQ